MWFLARNLVGELNSSLSSNFLTLTSRFCAWITWHLESSIFSTAQYRLMKSNPKVRMVLLHPCLKIGMRNTDQQYLLELWVKSSVFVLSAHGTWEIMAHDLLWLACLHMACPTFCTHAQTHIHQNPHLWSQINNPWRNWTLATLYRAEGIPIPSVNRTVTSTFQEFLHLY